MDGDGNSFAAFDKAPNFFEALPDFLNADLRREPTEAENQVELKLSYKLIITMEEYQEQAYLLDPYLEKMVTPVIDIFKAHAADFAIAQRSGNNAPYSSARLTRLTRLLYTFIKCRGWKTVVNFFPHQVADLSIALDYLSASDGPVHAHSQWRLRYILLLWLSLISMLPFDLSRFDEDVSVSGGSQSSTAHRIQSLAIEYLGRAGLERDAAAILLSKLYARKDTSSLLGEFINHAIAWLGDSPNFFKTIGILRVLCEIAKSGITDQVKVHVPAMHQVLKSIESNAWLLSNTVVRKLRTKLEGRLAVGVLPSRRPAMLQRARVLQPGGERQDESQDDDTNSDDVDISEDVESTISVLFEGLQDKDTTVRYSASKHLARISARLPPFLVEQVLENVLQLFSMHASPEQGVEDLPAVAEATWHGTCLTCAEMARRGLIPTNRLSELLHWLKKALLFDVRKGAHSVGSSVRDAASYVLWALARSQDGPGLRPHALSLAQRLVAVSLYDREIHIRRAASAAFQENVGRLSVFPHGIDVIRKTDFFAVGNRKNAFLVAAPQVAEHVEYRLALVEHLIANTLVHWDQSMRLLGAQSLKAVCELDLTTMGPLAEARVVILLNSMDTNDVHGGLLGISELAASYNAREGFETERLKIFKHLSKISSAMVEKHHNEQILEAACRFLENTLSIPAIQLDSSPTSRWRTFIEQGLSHRDTDVQEAAAGALQTLSTLIDLSSDVHRYVMNFARGKGTPTLQQSLARALGSLAYDKHEHAVRIALTCLLGGVDKTSETFSSNVEARRNCFSAIPELLCTLKLRVPQVFEPTMIHQVLQAYMRGLDDYTIDERGDVGSWIRMACIQGLCVIIELLFDIGPSLGPSGSLGVWLPPSTYQEVLGGILKQGVERLDNVRRQAGESFMKLLRRGPPNVDGSEQWGVHGEPLMKLLFLGGDDDVGWNEGQWFFPKAVRILEVEMYRIPVLRGLVLSVGSKTDSTQRPVAMCLTAYIMSLPHTTDSASGLDLLRLTNAIMDLARANLALNHIVIPTLQTLDLILDAGILGELGNTEAGTEVLQAVLDIATKNVARYKNIQRIMASMKIVHGMLSVPCMLPKARSFLRVFLLHAIPKVRTETAEHLYLVMQAKDLGVETDEAEELLLDTDWSGPVNTLKLKVDELVAVFGVDVNAK
ncbi:TBCD protein [Gautieria morchelliformis]|nr:TBCD protein [Gautieria morchelliformis]